LNGSYEEYREAVRAAGEASRAALVAEWLRRTDDADVLQHASAVAQTRFREGDVDGFLAIVDAFLDAHPRARPSEGRYSYLEILGRYPYLGREPDLEVSVRYARWLCARIAADEHPALLETLRQFLLAIVFSGDAVAECLRVVQDGRYPEERRDALRTIYREVALRAFSRPAPAAIRETSAKLALLWHPDELVFRRALVAALVEQGKHADAAALGTGWLSGHETDLGLLRWSMAALAGAGHVPEAIALFHRYGPGTTGDAEFGLLLFEAVGHYAELGRERDALAELEPFFEPVRGLDVTVLVAVLHLRFAQRERALHYARLAVERFGDLARARLRTPDLAPLAGDPDFESLIASPN